MTSKVEIARIERDKFLNHEHLCDLIRTARRCRRSIELEWDQAKRCVVFLARVPLPKSVVQELRVQDTGSHP